MTGFVLDYSVAVAWCFEDEAKPEPDTLLDRVQHEGAIVPPFWVPEVSNVLLMAHRRGRVDKETMQERMALLDMLPIAADEMAAGAVWRGSVLTLADVRDPDILRCGVSRAGNQAGITAGQQ